MPSSGYSTPKFVDKRLSLFIIVDVWQTPFSTSKPRAILGALVFWKHRHDSLWGQPPPAVRVAKRRLPNCPPLLSLPVILKERALCATEGPLHSIRFPNPAGSSSPQPCIPLIEWPRSPSHCHSEQREEPWVSFAATRLMWPATVSQQRLGKRMAQLSSARVNEVCAALRFSLGCDAS